MKRRCPRYHSFTLIELLVVIAIIALLVALALPALQPSKGTRISTAGQQVADALNLARQAAISQNRFTEVRFYNTQDSSGATNFCAFRIELYDDALDQAPTPFSKLTYLPAGIIMDSNEVYSPILSTTENPYVSLVSSAGGNQENLPNGLVTFCAIQFRPSGATTLKSGNWFASVKASTDPEKNGLPALDFSTVQLNANTGRVTLYHP